MVNTILGIVARDSYLPDVEATMSVYFQCKSCDAEHRSPAKFVDRQSFDASTMPDLQHVCRITGALTSYDKRDMYWRADDRVPADVLSAPVTPRDQ